MNRVTEIVNMLAATESRLDQDRQAVLDDLSAAFDSLAALLAALRDIARAMARELNELERKRDG